MLICACIIIGMITEWIGQALWSLVYLKGLSNAQPDGQVEADLCPSKDPGDGPQVVNAASRLALGGAAADVHAAQLADGRARLEELYEVGVAPHHLSVRIARHLRACQEPGSGGSQCSRLAVLTWLHVRAAQRAGVEYGACSESIIHGHAAR